MHSTYHTSKWKVADEINACAGGLQRHMIGLSCFQSLAGGAACSLQSYDYQPLPRCAASDVSTSPPQLYPPLPIEVATNAYDILLLSLRTFRTDRPRPEDAYYALSLFLHFRHLFPDKLRVIADEAFCSLLADAQNPFLACLQIGSGNPSNTNTNTRSRSSLEVPHTARDIQVRPNGLSKNGCGVCAG